jgi:hypothetical protein
MNIWPALKPLVGRGRITGPVNRDTRIAALRRHRVVRELWSADRDFGGLFKPMSSH